MKTRKIEIQEGITGKMTTASLLVCPDCDGDTWLVYRPVGVQHVHFQCYLCAAVFCDGGCASPEQQNRMSAKGGETPCP